MIPATVQYFLRVKSYQTILASVHPRYMTGWILLVIIIFLQFGPSFVNIATAEGGAYRG